MLILLKHFKTKIKKIGLIERMLHCVKIDKLKKMTLYNVHTFGETNNCYSNIHTFGETRYCYSNMQTFGETRYCYSVTAWTVFS